MDLTQKILVVDDFATMRKIVIKQLHEIGFVNIAEASDGDLALIKLKEEAFDFVITDWNMPGMEGIELLKLIRADAQLTHLPVLMITAEAKREQIIEAAQSGVNGYIVKPFAVHTLKEKIQKILDKLIEQ